MAAMNLIESKAHDIAEAVSKHDGLSAMAEDRPFLDFLIELIKVLGPLLLQCFASMAEARAAFISPSLVLRVRLKLRVRRELRDADSIDLLVGPIAASIFQVAGECTESELQDIAAAH